MKPATVIPHLFRTEYTKITAVLIKHFGLAHIEIAEDIASDTFLLASETWGIKGLPANPTAWLYTVAKNKAKDYLKKNALFNNKVSKALHLSSVGYAETDIDLSAKNIADSQLQMMFALCHPSIPDEAQIGLSLRILCGFGIQEIATAFLSNKETITKRLARAKKKLRAANVRIHMPDETTIDQRLEMVAKTLYLLFNEGYYSASGNVTLKKDLCLEAMRLTHLLIDHKQTNRPYIYALLALMYFQASRFEARTGQKGETILYFDQDESKWEKELIQKAEYFLNLAAQGHTITTYHLQAGIAYWHTIKNDSAEKWESILQLYNRLLQVEYSPIAALNRTYALFKANGPAEAIPAAERLGLTGNHLYHTLLGELYVTCDKNKAIEHFQWALTLAISMADKKLIEKKIAAIFV